MQDNTIGIVGTIIGVGGVSLLLLWWKLNRAHKKSIKDSAKHDQSEPQVYYDPSGRTRYGLKK